MPSGAVKRPRAAGASRSSSRAKESAELTRLSAVQSSLPPLSASFLPSRPNRRQRAAANAATSPAAPAPAPPVAARVFPDLPLSTRTLDGLAAARFVDLTDIQRLAVPQALAGRDVLAAAPTGSGKTLAFVVPVLEALWRARWSTSDGLGALVLAPTRELALQIFEVFRAVARFHMLSAGLVIGGKDFEFEKEKVGSMNVLVATPGRLLHHMDSVVDFDCSTLQVLVLDEADRILDMGFKKTLDAIVENLPKEGRQTLLFSATQTKSVKALARLSLQAPQYVSVTSTRKEGEETEGVDEDDAAEASDVKIVGVPAALSQSYTVVEPHEKLSVLWSFLKTHVKSKVIVFLATGKQVRFVYDSFCKLRPGVPLLHIHGNMKQAKRTDMYDLFCRTRNAVLFATDVASRGLDFPDVEWVVQVDCPDDVSSYVHRVGRTARFRANGRAMLLLNKGSEETFLKRLETRKLVLNRTRINPERITSITPRIAAFVAQSQALKSVAQRAFMFYLKSIHRQHDKEVFNAVDMDHGAFAESLGLAATPKVAFTGGEKKAGTSASGKVVAGSDGKNVFGYRPREDKEKPKKDGKKKRSLPDGSDGEGSGKGDDLADDGELLVAKKSQRPDAGADVTAGSGGDGSESPAPVPVARKRKRLKLDILQHGPSGNRIVFSDDGTAMKASEALRAEVAADDDSSGSEKDAPDDIEGYAAIVAKRMEKNAVTDRERERERVRTKKAKRKEKLRGKRPDADAAEYPESVDSASDDNDDDEDFNAALARIAASKGGKNDGSGGSDSNSGGDGREEEDEEEGESGGDAGGDEEDADNAALQDQALQILARRRKA